MLEREGRSVEVVDLRSLIPMDRETVLASVRKTSRALIVHEANITGGFGGEIAALIAQEAFEYLDAPVMRIASLDVPVPFSPPLEMAMLPSVDKILDAARQLLAY
jgi:2-oxoisovalerate dehydrogenase E1 component beta subunit